MSLRGDLRTMALPDVLQWIASGRKTGTLHVERRSVQKRIILREGNIFSSWSNDPRESLGQFLIRLRLVTEEQLFRALLGQEEKGRLDSRRTIRQSLQYGGIPMEVRFRRRHREKPKLVTLCDVSDSVTRCWVCAGSRRP